LILYAKYIWPLWFFYLCTIGVKAETLPDKATKDMQNAYYVFIKYFLVYWIKKQAVAAFKQSPSTIFSNYENWITF
jgi:hypothetical protein